MSANKTECTPCPTYNYPSGNLYLYSYYQNHCYIIVSQNYTWSNARKQCVLNDGYLMTINNDDEFNSIGISYMVNQLSNGNNETVWVRIIWFNLKINSISKRKT